MSPAEPVHELSHLRTMPDNEAEARLRTTVESSIGANFLGGHRISILRNGDEIFPSMLDTVRSAEHSIDFVTFVYWTGDIAQRFAEVLAERSTAGVRVRVVLDAFGSAPMKQSLIEKMTAAGVAIERFRPVVRWKFWEADHRTHRKIMIVDDRVAFTGGVGIAREWEGDARRPDEWRDTHFRIEGPAVLALKATFLTDWRDTGHTIEATDASTPRPGDVGDTEVAVVDASAQVGLNDAELALEALVASSKQRLVLQTPYFNPTPELSDLLRDALARGVEVDLLVPGPHVDKRVSDLTTKEMYLPLLEKGARVWRYQPTMMHVKAVLVDGLLSLVGSININRRSVAKDEETAVAILDRGITAELENDFQRDVSKSMPAKPGEQARPIQRRLAAKLLRPARDEL